MIRPRIKSTGRGGRRVGAGRKPLPEAEKLRNPVSVTFTDDEREKLEAAAAAKGEPLSAFIRRLVLRALARRTK